MRSFSGLDKFWGWITFVFYCVLAFFSFALALAALNVTTTAPEPPLGSYALLGLCPISILLSIKSASIFFRSLTVLKIVPKLDLFPFLSVALSLTVAIRTLDGF